MSRANWEVSATKIEDWAKTYQGPKFHCMFGDTPYHNAGSAETNLQWGKGDVSFRKETWQGIKEHLLPGAMCMAYGSAKNWHRLACAIEDAGFVFHPSMFLLYVYGSGMSKSGAIVTDNPDLWKGRYYGTGSLKPAAEPILVFQNPHKGKALDGMSTFGTGTLNVAGGRTGPNKDPWSTTDEGRWPTNLVLQHSEGCRISGFTTNTPIKYTKWVGGGTNIFSGLNNGAQREQGTRDCQYEVPVWECVPGCPVAATEEQSSGSSEFFEQSHWILDNVEPFAYSCKPITREKDAGLVEPGMFTRSENKVNTHPTVKSLATSLYLATLLLPPLRFAPRMLVPFAGTGTEMVGACLAGFSSVLGVEMVEHYSQVCRRRLTWWNWATTFAGTTTPSEILKIVYAKAKSKPWYVLAREEGRLCEICREPISKATWKDPHWQHLCLPCFYRESGLPHNEHWKFVRS